MKRLACLFVICAALGFASTASACDPCGSSALVFQQQRAFFVQPTNALFLNSGPQFVGNGFNGGANVNVIEQGRRGLFGGRRGTSVIQASAGGFGGGANVNVVSGRGR